MTTIIPSSILFLWCIGSMWFDPLPEGPRFLNLFTRFQEPSIHKVTNIPIVIPAKNPFSKVNKFVRADHRR
jgi:hypothetical protein